MNRCAVLSDTTAFVTGGSQGIGEEIALGEFVEAEDTAEIVAYLASEKGHHITAQDINVDAGTIWY